MYKKDSYSTKSTKQKNNSFVLSYISVKIENHSQVINPTLFKDINMPRQRTESWSKFWMWTAVPTGKYASCWKSFYKKKKKKKKMKFNLCVKA